MLKRAHESLLILASLMFDVELNFLSDEIIFKVGQFEISKTLSQNTSEIRKFS